MAAVQIENEGNISLASRFVQVGGHVTQRSWDISSHKNVADAKEPLKSRGSLLIGFRLTGNSL